jgi:hypothetical protein
MQTMTASLFRQPDYLDIQAERFALNKCKLANLTTNQRAPEALPRVGLVLAKVDGHARPS